MVKRLFYLLALSGMLASCKTDCQKLYLANSLKEEFKDVPIVITRNKLMPSLQKEQYPLVLSAERDTLASQLDDMDGDGVWDELAFLCDFKSGERKEISICFVPSPSCVPSFQKRTNVRYGKMSTANNIAELSEDMHGKDNLPRGKGYPYQLDGPAWENDKVAFRHYFDGRNNRDVFGKLVSDMVMDTIGINAEGMAANTYSDLNDWGRDILTVGSSLGLGGIALQTPDSLVRLGVLYNDTKDNVDTTYYKLVTEGPVRSVLRLEYNGWNAGCCKIDKLKETITIWAGHYSYESKVETSALLSECRIVTGMVDIENEKEAVIKDVDGKYCMLATHDRQANNKETYLGLSLVVPSESANNIFEASDIARSNIHDTWCIGFKNNMPIEYEAFAAWGESNKAFDNRNVFLDYVEKRARLKANPIAIEFE